MSYYEIYLKRLNRYGMDYNSRVQNQREREFEHYLLKTTCRVDIEYNSETIPASFERYKQDETETLAYLLTRRATDIPNGTVLFIAISTPLILAMIWVLLSKRKEFTKFLKICVGILLGGTIGNYIDRIWLGGVRDFIYFKSINFAIFNIADAAVTIGGVLLIIGIIVEMIKTFSKKEKAK